MNARIKLITDSACDIPAAEEQRYGIRIMSFPVTVGDRGYMEREDFTPEEFYEIVLHEPKIPVTSQITSIRFYEEFKQTAADGYTEIIYVSINGGGSSTYASACMAREELYEKHPELRDKLKIHLVDSHTYCAAYGYAVVEAAKKIERGASSAEIVAYLEDWFASVEIYVAPFTLEFVKKSGRVPCAAAFVGELMGLRPIISIIDGETKVIEKVRGDKAVIPALLKHASAARIPHTPYLVVGGVLPEPIAEMEEKAKKQFGSPCAGSYHAGAAITINIGPKMVAVIVKGKNRR